MGQQEILEHLDLRKDEEILWQGQPNTFKKLYKTPDTITVFGSLILLAAALIPVILFGQGSVAGLIIVTAGILYAYFGRLLEAHFINKYVRYFITNRRVILLYVIKYARTDFHIENIYMDKSGFEAEKDGSGFIWAGRIGYKRYRLQSGNLRNWTKDYCILMDISDVKSVYDILLSAVEKSGHEEPVSYNKLPFKW